MCFWLELRVFKLKKWKFSVFDRGVLVRSGSIYMYGKHM